LSTGTSPGLFLGKWENETILWDNGGDVRVTLEGRCTQHRWCEPLMWPTVTCGPSHCDWDQWRRKLELERTTKTRSLLSKCQHCAGHFIDHAFLLIQQSYKVGILIPIFQRWRLRVDSAKICLFDATQNVWHSFLSSSEQDLKIMGPQSNPGHDQVL
jgi:hypothetical protein